MRVRTNAGRMYERRAVSLAAIIGGMRKSAIGLDEVRTVDLDSQQSRKALEQASHIAARGLLFDGNRYGETVVFNQNNERQFFKTRRIDAFPKLAFACGSFAAGYERDF